MIPKDYVCDGQLNLWDYLGTKEKICECEENLQENEDSEFTPAWEPCGENFPPLDPDIASGKKKPYEYNFERFIGEA